MADMGEHGLEDVIEVAGLEGQAGHGNPGHGRLQWTAAMSGFVLRRFTDLVGEGVKTDKGFKEVHLNQVAKDLAEFSGLDVTGTQVYNHLRKWRTRWVKICRLKELSGANWDDENYMITLDPSHFAGHVKDHPKDAEFLNAPLMNYMQMQVIFGSGIATGRFAMGSNEALGQPTEPDVVEVDADAPQTPVAETNDNKQKAEASGSGKRKRSCFEESPAMLSGLTDAVWAFATAVAESSHAEAAPGIYEAVMACPNFTREALMFALGHLMENKATALVFVKMTADDKDLWLRTFLGKNYYD